MDWHGIEINIPKKWEEGMALAYAEGFKDARDGLANQAMQKDFRYSYDLGYRDGLKALKEKQ